MHFDFIPVRSISDFVLQNCRHKFVLFKSFIKFEIISYSNKKVIKKENSLRTRMLSRLFIPRFQHRWSINIY